MPVVYAILLADGRFGAAFWVSLLHLVARAAARGPLAYRRSLWRRIGLILALILLSYLAPSGACLDRRDTKDYTAGTLSTQAGGVSHHVPQTEKETR